MGEVEIAMETCQAAIRKKSIRIQEFFVDFDRLRSGHVHPNQFVTALGIAGIDTCLTDDDLNALKLKYSFQKEGCPDMVDYKAFCKDVNIKKDSLTSSLKQTRSWKNLNPEEDARVSELLGDIAETCQRKGILVKPMFVDFAHSNNSTKLVGHVTQQQFHRTLDVKLGIKISEQDVTLLCAKYSNPDYAEMVDYISFANDILPEEKPYNPYTAV